MGTMLIYLYSNTPPSQFEILWHAVTIADEYLKPTSLLAYGQWLIISSNHGDIWMQSRNNRGTLNIGAAYSLHRNLELFLLPDILIYLYY